MLSRLLEQGYEDRLLVSQDAAVFSRITPPSWRAAHAPQWRLNHLHTSILPRLRAAGMDQSLEHKLLVENPRRLMTGEPLVSPTRSSDSLRLEAGRFRSDTAPDTAA